MPASLISSTVKGATLIAAGQATVAGVVPAKVAALMEGVVMCMMLTKLSKAAVAGLVVLCLCGLGVGGYQSLTTQEAVGKDAALLRGNNTILLPNLSTPAKDSSDLEKLQGKWRMVESENDGVKDSAVAVKKSMMTLIVCGDEMWLQTDVPGEQQSPTKFKLQPGSTPKRIDYFEQDNTAKTHGGIYKLEENKLWLCFSLVPGGKWPDEFRTMKGNNRWLCVYERSTLVQPSPESKKENEGHPQNPLLAPLEPTEMGR